MCIPVKETVDTLPEEFRHMLLYRVQLTQPNLVVGKHVKKLCCPKLSTGKFKMNSAEMRLRMNEPQYFGSQTLSKHSYAQASPNAEAGQPVSFGECSIQCSF